MVVMVVVGVAWVDLFDFLNLKLFFQFRPKPSEKKIVGIMAASSKSQPKTNREFAAQSGPSGPKRSHSPQPELKSAEAQASERPRAKKKSGKSNWSRKKGRSSGKSNWASYNSQREKGNGKKQKNRFKGRRKNRVNASEAIWPFGSTSSSGGEPAATKNTRSSNGTQFFPSYRFEAPRHAI